MLEVVGSVLLLLVSTVVFVNGVEALAGRLGLTRFAAGALLAAVLTALPETVITLLSPLYQTRQAELVGMGSVLAAPSITLLIGAPVVALSWRRPNISKGVAKNYVYFLLFMSTALLLSQLSLGPYKYLYGLVFLSAYVYMAHSIYVEEGEGFEAAGISVFEKIFGFRNTGLVGLQVSLSAVGLTVGADVFIEVVSSSASPLANTLLISPLATCLQEVLLASYWMLRQKADISISLLSGENLIQSTFVAGVGMVFTDWSLPTTSLSVLTVYAAAAAVLSLTAYLNKFKLGGVVMSLYPAYVLASLAVSA